MRQDFAQAAFGNTPDILNEIHDAAKNVAIWQRDVPQETKGYFNSLSLASFWRYGDQETRLWSSVLDWGVIPRRTQAGVLGEKRRLVETLSMFPGMTGRRLVADQIYEVGQVVGETLRRRKVGFSIIIFNTLADRWHVDAGSHRAVMTLAGQAGTIWLPDQEIDLPPGRKGRNLEIVDYKAHPVQDCGLYNVALFKCANFKNPWVHATPGRPMVSRYRMAITLGGVA